MHVGPGVKGNLYFHLLLDGSMKRAEVDLLLAPLNVLPLRSSFPSILVLHDITPLEHPAWHRLKNRLTTVPFYDRSFRRASRIVCVSHGTASILHRHFPETADRTVVIPHGFPTPPEETAPLPDTIPEPFILSLATREPRKNLAGLVEAHAADPALPPLVIAGAPGWKTRLRPGPNLHLLGHVDERLKWTLYSRASLFVFPSFKEGFGLPVWEALAAGTPVVSTPVPAVSEFPLPHCLIVDPDPNSLLGGIRKGLEMSKKAVDRTAFPSWSQAAQAYANLVEEVADRS